MTDITVSFVDRTTISTESDESLWFVQGLTPGTDTNAATERLATTGDAAGLCTEHGDAAVVRVSTGHRPSVELWKSLFSSRELFWCVRPNGDIVVTDHFRNMMAALPVAERAPSDLTLAAHYLYRKPFVPLTIAGSVSRLPGGRHVTIDPRTGATTDAQFERVSADVVERRDDEYLDLIEEALLASVADLDDATTAIMFSGGVDSTLLLSLRPESLQPVSWVPDTAEFQAEVQYARRAATLLGRDIEGVELPEAGFVRYLEEAARATGIAAFDDASPYFHQAFRAADHPTFVLGLGADSAFGPGLRLARVANWLRFAPTRVPLVSVAPRLSGQLGYRADQLASRAAGIARDPWDPDGWAGKARLFGNPDVVGRMTDPTHPRRLRELQLTTVRDAVEGAGTTSDRFIAHVEIRHWATTFAGALHDARHAAEAYGKAPVGPFLDWRVQRALATVPLEKRYVVGLRSKWILKDILKRRVPDYPVDQRKKATALPWKRFYTNGPLVGFFDEYPVPDVIPTSMRDHVVSTPTNTTWSAISHAVWDEHVHRNTSLSPIAPTSSASRTVD